MLANTMKPRNGRNTYRRLIDDRSHDIAEFEAQQQRGQQAQGSVDSIRTSISAVSTNSNDEFEVPQSQNHSMEYMREFRQRYNESHEIRSPEAQKSAVPKSEVQKSEVQKSAVPKSEVLKFAALKSEVLKSISGICLRFEDFKTRNELATANGQDPEIGKFHILYAHNMP